MSSPLPAGPLAEMTELLYKGRKIQAIKVYREATGVQLMDAKNAIEKFEKELRAAAPEKFTVPPGGKGCATTVTVTTLAILVAIGAAFFLLAG